MKKQFFLFLFLCAAASLWAQTDMTDRIVNPGFEDEINGWEIRKMSRQGNNEFPLKVGDYYVETWSGAGSRVADGSVDQVIHNLPAGTYTVSVAAQNIQQNDAQAKQTGVWVYANDDKTEVNLPDKYEVKVLLSRWELLWILVGWSAGEESGITGVAVKCVEIGRNTSGEGGFLD